MRSNTLKLGESRMRNAVRSHFVGLSLAVAWLLLPSLTSGVEAGIGPFAALNCDTNGAAGRDLSDAVYIFIWLFGGGPDPVPLLPPGGPSTIQNGDCNGDKKRDISDGVYLLNWLFAGGPEPVAGELDTDSDGIADRLDNCPLVKNADQADTNQDGVGDACESSSVSYVGALTSATGRWTYTGQIGLPGADAMCSTISPGARVCTAEELKKLIEANQVVDPVDTAGHPVASFWSIDASLASGLQCSDLVREGTPWTYQTAHLGCTGVSIDLTPGGTGFTVQDKTICATTHAVACCK